MVTQCDSLHCVHCIMASGVLLLSTRNTTRKYIQHYDMHMLGVFRDRMVEQTAVLCNALLLLLVLRESHVV